jgi:hypothetical protein
MAILKINVAPTDEQRRWLKAHKTHALVRFSMGAKFGTCGTLHPDGRFVPEGPKTPLTDGNGMFSVGVPTPARRRSR